MAIRFDRGELKSPFKTEDGILICEAAFAKDGVLEYRLPDGGTRRELRLPEENKKALTSFGIAPVTIEHPPVLVTEDNADRFRKGISLQNVVYGKGGFVRGEVALMDSEAIDYATRSDGAEISAGYTCDIEQSSGEWKGSRYDCIQRNIKVNHLALTKRGRAGPEVRLHLDSADTDIAYQIHSIPPPKSRMASIRIDSVDYEIPETLAPLVGAKLKRLDELEDEVPDLEEKIDTLTSQVEELTDERDRERGRSDALEICLTNADIILEEGGYKRDATGNYIRTDKKGKMPWMEEEDVDDEEVEEDLDGKETKHTKGKHKKKKMDSAEPVDVRLDAKNLMVAWKEADSLVENLSTEHFDSAESPSDVRRLVVAKLRPNLKLDSMSEGAIDGIYEFLKEEVSTRTDGRKSYSDELNTVVSAARASAGGSGLTAAAQSRSAEVSNNYTKPMSLSK